MSVNVVVKPYIEFDCDMHVCILENGVPKKIRSQGVKKKWSEEKIEAEFKNY